ncbi:mitotic-spindle organizing gamma-tubulin ring associated-domain-containing protein [Neocallimastix sp. 'constans']
MDSEQAIQARETIEILYEISQLLNTDLDRETLSYCISLCEAGVNPEALAAVIKELKQIANVS